MIIDITRARYASGYIPKAEKGFFNPFFPTCNAAFRRQAIEAIGGFDPKCQTGEDVDVSIRLSYAGWELWYEPTAVVKHRDRRTMGQLLHQWFGYGQAQPYLYRKHLGQPRLQIYSAGKTGNSRPYSSRCILDIPFFCYALIFLSAYHLFHAALLVLLAGAIFHSTTVCLWAAAVALVSGLYYATIRFDWRHPLQSLRMVGVRYASDTAFVAGALIAGLRRGTLFLHATRTR